MSKKKYLCGILGYPLKKPRSIKIWKSYFRIKNINSSMKKFEIPPKKISSFINYIKQNNNFLAMAVTMPYKKKLFNYIDKSDDFALRAKSLNLVLKRNNFLYGYNTDIYGAIHCLKPFIKKFKEVIIIGMGGTGQAIYNFLFFTFKKKKFHLISRKFYSKKKNVKIYRKLIPNLLKESMLIINCTPLGSNLKIEYKNKSPIQKRFFKIMNKKSVIFDIIYSPQNTLLSKIAKSNKIKYLNGTTMNTLQAKQALKIVFKNQSFQLK